MHPQRNWKVAIPAGSHHYRFPHSLPPAAPAAPLPLHAPRALSAAAAAARQTPPRVKSRDLPNTPIMLAPHSARAGVEAMAASRFRPLPCTGPDGASGGGAAGSLKQSCANTEASVRYAGQLPKAGAAAAAARSPLKRARGSQ
jgi:hypothetical protein